MSFESLQLKQNPAIRTIALAGNPNSGKTTLFNAFTKLRQKVGNYSGVTVEKKTGTLVLAKDRVVNVIDLPGTYSLSVRSPDEEIARDVLLGRTSDTPKPDIVVCVVDAGNLERNLYLVTQIQDLGVPMIIALNMMDEVERQGREIDASKLSQRLGVPVVPTVANQNKGIEELKQLIAQGINAGYQRGWRMAPDLEEEIGHLAKLFTQNEGINRHEAFAEALTYLSHSKVNNNGNFSKRSYQKETNSQISMIHDRLQKKGLRARTAAIEARYDWIKSIIKDAVKDKNKKGPDLTERIDAVLTHKFFGWVFFFGIMVFMFYMIFTVATIPMDLIDKIFNKLGDLVTAVLLEGDLRDLIVNPQKSVKYDFWEVLICLIPTMQRYNMAHKTLAIENILEVWFVSHAQRTAKNPMSLRGNPSDSFWWDGLDSSFLQKDRSQKTNPEEFGSALSSRSIPIPCLRIDSGDIVRDYHGTQAHQQNRDPAVQRIFSGDSGIESFPGSNNIAKIFETIESAGDSTVGQTARQSARLFVGIAPKAHESDLRHRFGGDHDLWQTRRSQSRLQSQEAGQTIVSSALLLRGASARILAWNAAPRQRQFLYGNHRVLASLSGQNAIGDRQKPDSFQNGFGILRTENHPIPRRVWLRLRHRGQRIFSDQNSGTKVPVPKTPERLGSRRILREHQSKMEQPASLYRGTASHPRRPARSQTIDFVQRPQVRLSCVRYQSRYFSLASLSVLLSTSHHREKQSRVSLRLSPGQGSYSYVDFQRRLLSIAFVLGQYCSLVQETLSAPRIFDRHVGYHSHRLLGSSGQADQTWNPKYFDLSQRLPLPPGVPRGFAQNSKTPSAQRFSFLQVNRQSASSRQLLKMAFSRIFEVNGIIAGVGGVVIFLPQILILFFFIGLLQDTGYMVRAAFIMDRVMNKVGLHGKSFIPLLSSFACAIPGIMSARTIENPKDRLVTILVAPLMSCSARLPVYAVMIAVLMPSATGWQKAGIMLIMYMTGIIGACGMAWFFKKTLMRSQKPVFIMELPPYRLPSWKAVVIHMWERSRLFLKRAGTVILAMSIILWALMTYPKHPGVEKSEALKLSFAGQAGTMMEPVIKPLGYDWRIGIGLIGSFTAREVFVSTMSIVFDLGEDSKENTLREAFQKASWPDGKPLFTHLCV